MIEMRWLVKISIILLLIGQIFGVSIARGPYLSCVSTSGITITFETDLPTITGVRWATEDYWDIHSSFEHDSSELSFVSHHSVELGGLTPWTDYVYKVYTDDSESPIHYFRTAPDEFEPFSFVAYGDTRTNQSEHTTIANTASSFGPQIVFNTGDLITDGNSWYGAFEWTSFFDAIAELAGNAPYYPVVGNHEDEIDSYFCPIFELPGNEQWYSIDYSNCHFIILNNNTDYSPGSEQYAFVSSDLAAAYGHYSFIFVFFHRPPYTCGSEHSSNTTTRTTLCPLFETYGVSIVFNGHNHDYERNYVNGVYYIVTGGGGAPLYGVSPESTWTIYAESCYHFCLIEVVGDSLHFTARYDDGTVFDEFSLISPLRINEQEISKPRLKLSARPNPFNSSVEIVVSDGRGLVRQTLSNIEIYDLQGDMVYCRRGLLTSNDDLLKNRHREMSPTSRTFIWTPNETIASGIYFVRATMKDGQSITKKIFYLK